MSPSIASGGGALWAFWVAQPGSSAYQVSLRPVTSDGQAATPFYYSPLSSASVYSRPSIAYNPRGVFKWCCQINTFPLNVAVAPDMWPTGPDTFPPITSVATAKLPNSHGWYKSTGAITLVADEEHAPATQYSWTSATGPWTAGTSIAGGAAQGTRTLQYFSADSSLNTETVRASVFKVDATAPRTSAPKSASVKRNKWVKLYYKVTDAYTANKAYVKLVIKKGSGTKKTIDLRLVTVNVSTSLSWKATLPKGSYRFYVYATDQAGNTQSNIASNVLTVK
jgi:hypothetical protein